MSKRAPEAHTGNGAKRPRQAGGYESPTSSPSPDAGGQTGHKDPWATRLRESARPSPHARAASVRKLLRGGLQGLLVERSLAKPIWQWSQDDLYGWYEKVKWQYPRVTGWRDIQDEDTFNEGQVEAQLLLWSIRCSACLAYRKEDCDTHTLTECRTAEGLRARSIRDRLRLVAAEVHRDGIAGYGAVPWCDGCHLPRSRCPAWTKWDRDGLTEDGEQKGDDRQWSLRDRRQCRFPDVVVDAVAAMGAFQGPNATAGWRRVTDWRDGSRIRFNEHWDVHGWLFSPMTWDGREVPVVLRVFYQLGVGMEDAWIRADVERRRAELGALSAEDRDRELARRQQGSRPGQDSSTRGRVTTATATATATLAKETTVPNRAETSPGPGPPAADRQQQLRDILTDVLDEAEYKSEQAAGFWGGMAFLTALQEAVLQWSRSGIRCQLCRIHGWSEGCYLHDVTACEAHPAASKRVKETLESWSGLCGGQDGEGKLCRWCQFPLAACRPGRYRYGWESKELARDEEDYRGGEERRRSLQLWASETGETEGRRCYGIEVIKRTTAALLTVEGGLLGRVVLEREARPGRRRAAGAVMDTEGRPTRGSMEEQVRVGFTKAPLLAVVFLGLANGLDGLWAAGWERNLSLPPL
ncbi:hypothetical protein NKR23_g12360 [Pleurostoma richardsiae]|uniref:Uncharacterized protein n=1 Tax=Pleurostoma richardsiae TaxID=41990 RepID=A0AA38RGD8_9PEZI|nr:hypothetical protein NKR23_g12360 [Pleurostoma richardsiae]